MNGTYELLLDYIRGLEVIDTHEHLPAYEHDRAKDTDILSEYLTHYFSSDLVSAGLPRRELAFARDPKRPLAERWRAVESYWEVARGTGYGQALDLAAMALYGVAKITGDTLEAANAAFLERLNAGGQYKHVLRSLCNIRTSILNVGGMSSANGYGCDRAYFTPVFSANEWIRPASAEEMIRLTESRGLRLRALSDYEQALREELESAKHHGVCGIKCSLAYNRSLRFSRTPRPAAEEQLTRALTFDHAVAWRERPGPGEIFEDYIMHSICALAGELGLPVQIHAGIQEGNGNLLAASDPMLLNNLFFEYPETRFDIFHTGYPWHIQLAALAKMFPNVHIDMCWTHIISPNAAVAALSEYLDAVPINKIMAFGGDYCFLDGVPAHLEMARRNVARTLAGKVELGAFDADRAKQIARMLFFDNPANLFNIR